MDRAMEKRFKAIVAARGEMENRDPKKYWDDVWKYGPPSPKHWCGGFVLWCLHQADIALDINWTFQPPRYGFLWRLKLTKNPLPGDVAYFDVPYRHHALVVSLHETSLITIDGNTTINKIDKLPPRVLEKSRDTTKCNVVFYSIDKFLE